MSLPDISVTLAGKERANPIYWRWFKRIEELAAAGVITNGQASADIAALARYLGSPDGTVASIPPAPPRILSTDQLPEGFSRLYFTNERAQDAVGTILTDSATVDFTYDNAANTITAIVPNDAITNAQLANVATATLKGRSTAGTGDPEDLTAAQARTLLNVADGATAYTDTLARAAVVIDSIADSDTDHAPSRNAVFDALAGKLANNGGAATGDYTFDTTTLTIDSVNNRVGLGTATPQRTVHVVGPDGPVASYPSAAIGLRNILVLENNHNCNIAVLANPSNQAGFFYLKSGAAAFSGALQYDFPSDSMTLYAAAGARVTIDASGHTRPATSDNTQDHGAATYRWANSYATNLRPGAGAVIWTSGSGTPESVVVAPVGSLFTRTDGGASTTLYVKESGSGNTGWRAV